MWVRCSDILGQVNAFHVPRLRGRRQVLIAVSVLRNLPRSAIV
jgi:hypothetical protein